MQRAQTFPAKQSFNAGEGGGWQLATPQAALEHMCTAFGVHVECFASPLNAHMDTFCSVFPDTDAAFGSLGSFFDKPLERGCFQVGPPYEVTVLTLVARKLLAALVAAQDAGALRILPLDALHLTRASVSRGTYSSLHC